MKRWMLMGLVISLAGIVLVGYALLTPTVTQSGGTGTGSGQSQTHYSYAQVNIVLSIVGSVMATGGGALLMHRREDTKIPINYAEPSQPRTVPSAEVDPSKVPEKMAMVTPTTDNTDGGSHDLPNSGLVLRLLEGDERVMFRALMDKGGEAFQKDLVVVTKMSDAKASRVLDRLIEKGIIYKERHGMTNKVRVRIDR